MISVKHNIPAIKDKLKRIRLLVESSPSWRNDIINQMQKALENVTKATPKSENQGKHIQSGWTLKTIGGGPKDRIPILAIIYNKFTHTPDGKVKEDAKLETSKGKQEYTLLHILEYGSASHSIDPINKQSLHFTSKSGEEVFARHVEHPGTRPYGMVRTTRAKLKFWIRKLQERWAKKISQEWHKGGSK